MTKVIKETKLKEMEAVLFDFEGTLVDFQWNLAGAVRETLAMLEQSGFDIKPFMGLKYSTLMLEAQNRSAEANLPPDQVRKSIGVIYDRFDEDALSRWSLRPNAEKLLETLKNAEIKAGLVSNIGKKTLTKAMVKMRIQSFFDIIVTRNDVHNLKPHPEGILKAMSRLNASEDRTLFVGDSLDDIQAARAAGVKAMIILGGENKQADLLAARADELFSDYDELLALL